VYVAVICFRTRTLDAHRTGQPSGRSQERRRVLPRQAAHNPAWSKERVVSFASGEGHTPGDQDLDIFSGGWEEDRSARWGPWLPERPEATPPPWTFEFQVAAEFISLCGLGPVAARVPTVFGDPRCEILTSPFPER
jgi:hypothetical protein